MVVMAEFMVVVSGLKIKTNQELQELQAEVEAALNKHFEGRLGDFGTVSVDIDVHAGTFEE